MPLHREPRSDNGGWNHPKRDGAGTSGGVGRGVTAAAERPEAVRAQARALAPEVVAGEVDVLPAERGEVGEQHDRNRLAAVAQGADAGQGKVGVA